MSKPKKPETPESEKQAQRNQVFYGEKGTKLLRKHGDAFVLNNTRNDATRSMGHSSAQSAIDVRDMQIANKKASLSKRAKSIGQVGGMTSKNNLAMQRQGDSIRSNKLTSGSKGSVGQLERLTRSQLNQADTENMVAMDRMRRQFGQRNELVNLAGAVGGYSMAHFDIGKTRNVWGDWDENKDGRDGTG